jgi:hypothetical protein
MIVVWLVVGVLGLMLGRETSFSVIIMSIPVVGPIGLSNAYLRSETDH